MAFKIACQDKFDIDELSSRLEQPDIKVILVFYGINLTDLNPVKHLKEKFPQALCFGMSSDGTYSSDGGTLNGIAAVSLSANEVECAWAVSGKNYHDNSLQLAYDLAKQLKQAAGEGPFSKDHYLGFVFPDGTIDEHNRPGHLVRALAEQFGDGVSFVGGAAMDLDHRYADSSVSLNTEAMPRGAVVVLLKMKIPFKITHCIHFTPTKASFMVTDTREDGRILATLDSKPAAQIYAEATRVPLNRLKMTLPDTLYALGTVGTTYEGVKSMFLKDVILEEDDESLRLASPIQKGLRAFLLKGTKSIPHSSADALAVLKPQWPVSGAIHFNCASRAATLHQKREDKEFMTSLSAVPFICGNCAGEIGFGVFHNMTMISVLFG